MIRRPGIVRTMPQAPDHLPTAGRPAADVLAELGALRADDLPVDDGTTWAYLYDPGRPEMQDLARKAHAELHDVNALDPTAFPSTIALERSVVATVAHLLGGAPGTAGIFTSGGTESILLAVKAARDAAALPEGRRGRVVVPSTAHPAFDKAARYLALDRVVVPVDPVTFRADPAAMAAAIDADTVLVVASAVSYPHGVLDPVTEIAAAAAAAGVPCHVDACVGGMLLPFQRTLGEDVAPFDLAVPGVTSICVDLHKYGYAPKGASVLLFADAEMRRRAYFAGADWPGYPIVNPTMQSARSAGPLAAAWSLLQGIGEDGFVELTRRVRDAVRRLHAGIDAIDGLRVLGEPSSSLLALAAEEGERGVDVLALADEVRARGWFVQVQLSHAPSPVSLHLTATGVSPERVDGLLEALTASVAAVRAAAPVAPPAEIAAALASLDPATLTAEAFAQLAGAIGLQPGGVPGAADGAEAEATPRSAEINHLLDAAPPAVREVLLTHVLGLMLPPLS